MGSRVSKTLLSRGFFPKELPQVFSSESFAACIAKLRARKFGEFERKSSAWTSCDTYSFPHSKVGRRTASIPNPQPFFALAELISKNWKSIQEIYDESSFSFSRPRFNSSARAVSSSDFEGYRESLVTRASGYSYVLHADFARYFPTIYTHAIEWAVHGKAKSKSNLKKKIASREYLWASDVDAIVRFMQDGQTQGLPIGPDTSYIIAEIMGAAIDREFGRLFRAAVHGSRQIDDYALFFESRSDADRAHAMLARAAAEFQIALNDEKSYVDSLRGVSKEDWVYQLSEFNGTSVQEQRREIHRFTDLAITIAEGRGNAAAAKYAARVLARHKIHQKNIGLFVACMLRLVAYSPDALPLFVDAIIGYVRVGYKVNKEPIAIYLRSVLPRSIELGHDKEAIWLLWLGICLSMKIDVEVINAVASSACSQVILLAKLAEERGLCTGVKQSVIGGRVSAEDFRSKNWLLAYEGSVRGWFGWSPEDVQGSNLTQLANNGVRFLDLSAVNGSRINARRNVKAFPANADALPEVEGDDAEINDWDGIDFKYLDELLDIDMDPDSYGSMADRSEEEEEEEEEEVGLY
ncbi:RNA-directed DNA polymerase [Stenotrophomonas rhizophila]|uniref:RNA-directed DNA polymerase n=1 Tax=Stenotrophomonas rhizophila TaxID=216778 RepID=UPI003AF63B82